MSPRGWFLAIEGPDGTGKTTQVERLLKQFQGSVLVPGCSRSPIGKLVRRGLSGEEPLDPFEMQCAYTADRLARDGTIRNLLEDGTLLVADRWTMSALVYGALHLEDRHDVREHRSWLFEINAPVAVPDLYVVLLATPECIFDRLQKRFTADGGKREVYERDDLVRKAVAGYKDIVDGGHWIESPIHAIDTTDMTEDDVADAVTMAWKGLESGRFKKKEKKT
jgi:dTMP kinase